MDEQNISKKVRLSLLQFLISLIAIFAPLLYLVGLSFYNGYTSTYGISSDIFEMSVQDVYYVGYVAIFTSLFDLSEFLSGYFLSLKGIVFILSFFTLLCIMAITIRFFLRRKQRSFHQLFNFLQNQMLGKSLALADKNDELERTKQEAVDLEKSKAIADERTRIMRDMHDGIGGQLVATLALLELEPGNETKNNIAAILKACLDDFRLIINSLNVHANTLDALLADFKYLISTKLEKMDIALSWDVLSLPDDVVIDPQQSLHILRILQEAFTNVMKHSNATEISLHAQCNDGIVSLTIKDNGHNTETTEVKNGHGLDNMKWRAEQLSADLNIVSDANQGYTLILTLPVSSPVDSI